MGQTSISVDAGVGDYIFRGMVWGHISIIFINVSFGDLGFTGMENGKTSFASMSLKCLF